MHHGATYIHTKTRLVTTDCNTTDQGKQVSLTFMATAPTLGVVSPALQPRHQHLHSAVLACGGGGRGREGCMPQLLGEGWAVVARETGFSEPDARRHVITLSILA